MMGGLKRCCNRISIKARRISWGETSEEERICSPHGQERTPDPDNPRRTGDSLQFVVVLLWWNWISENIIVILWYLPGHCCCISASVSFVSGGRLRGAERVNFIWFLRSHTHKFTILDILVYNHTRKTDALKWDNLNRLFLNLVKMKLYKSRKADVTIHCSWISTKSVTSTIQPVEKLSKCKIGRVYNSNVVSMFCAISNSIQRILHLIKLNPLLPVFNCTVVFRYIIHINPLSNQEQKQSSVNGNPCCLDCIHCIPSDHC